ncbi:MAG: 2-succinyl-5-enolpyruvyl-6-hydroxy-3-cyclohexene-1-carboxylic-acid synthase [Actinomycetota bacterium]
MKPANAGQAQAVALVDELIRCGVAHASLSPGSRSTPLALALAARPELKLHVSIDERSMSFLALGIAKASRKPVAMLTTSGSAAAHLHPAIIEASFAQVPLIALTADRPPELRDTGAGQTIDQIKLFGDAVRWFCEVGVPEARADSVPYWRSIACRAYSESLWPVPGPVHLNLAYRNPLVPVADGIGFPFDAGGRPDGAPWTKADHSPLGPSKGDLARLGLELDRASRGMIVAGTSDFDPAPIVELSDVLGWPLLAEASSNCRQGPNSIACYDALVRQEGFWEAHRPDLVLRFGSLGTSNKLAGLLDSSIPQIAIHPGAWLDPGRAVARIVRAHPKPVCRGLRQVLGGQRPESGWIRSWRSADAGAAGAIDAYLEGAGALTEPGIARALPACLPDGSALMVASSMPVRDLDWFMRSTPGVRVLANRGANGIDGFVSSCLGVALSGSRSPTVGLCGDLSLLHDQNGFLLASNDPLDVVFVVINNNGGGIFSFLPQATEPGFERLFGTPHNHDFAPLAKSFGCSYRAIHSASELASAVAEATAEGGIHIFEAKTDRRENVEVHNRIWKSVGEAIGTDDE